MNDKDWLEKVLLAQKTYGSSVEVDAFVKWLFKQYGIVHPDDRNNK
jgi:hypothetical protein